MMRCWNITRMLLLIALTATLIGCGADTADESGIKKISGTFTITTDKEPVVELLPPQINIRNVDAALSNVLITQGEQWRFHDEGIDLGSDWVSNTYDDSSWNAGHGELGYGDGDEETVVSYGDDPINKPLTTYFRHSFNLINTIPLDGLNLDLIRDDGAVVYLNGIEVARSNMPEGTVSYQTRASTMVSSPNESLPYSYAIDPSLLHQGINVIAVEIHQYTANNSDISFDLSLTQLPKTVVQAISNEEVVSGSDEEILLIEVVTPPPADENVTIEVITPPVDENVTIEVVVTPPADDNLSITEVVRTVDDNTDIITKTTDNQFFQKNSEMGLVLIEAEKYSASHENKGIRWTHTSETGALGTGAMIASPDYYAKFSEGYTASSPRLDYLINFQEQGTYYIWIRALGRNSATNSLHIGLNSNVVSSAEHINVPVGETWQWTSNTMSENIVTLEIKEPGNHTLNVWMREAGTIIDQIILTSSPTFSPAPRHIQATDSDGWINIEAENYDDKVNYSPYVWQKETLAGASKNLAMTASPNAYHKFSEGYEHDSPRLDYRVEFKKTGTHYVWIRGLASAASSNSINLGLNGIPLPSLNAINIIPSANWTWSRETMSGTLSTIEIATPGIYTINAWIREAFLNFDKIAITVNPDSVPYVEQAPYIEQVTDINTPADKSKDIETTPPTNNDPSVVFNIDFNNLEENQVYTFDQLQSEWGARSAAGVDQGRVKIVRDPQGQRGNVMQVFYNGGSYGLSKGGAQWEAPIGGKYEEIYFAYDAMFEEGFDFALGAKLPGLMGGEVVSGGKKPTGENGWSGRMMFWDNGKLANYVYHAGKSIPWGEIHLWDDSGSQAVVTPGVWHKLEMRVVMNTPGTANGIIQAWFDGQLVLETKKFKFRTIDKLKIDKIFFSSFFGGCCDSSYAPDHDEYIYFDNFTVSTRPITH